MKTTISCVTTGYVQLLAESELLALLVILFLGPVIDQAKTLGFKLGVAAVLFIGLILATIKPEIQVSPLIYTMGLALLVHTTGLEAGSEFLSSLCSRGIKHNLFGTGVLAAVITKLFLLIKFLPIGPTEGTGAFAGTLTNAPTIAVIADAPPSPISDRSRLAAVHDMPVVRYFLACPIGVLAVIASTGIMSKVSRINHDQEAIDADVAVLPLHTRNIKVLKEDLPSITGFPPKFGSGIVISCIEYKDHLCIPSPGNAIPVGDIVSVVGTEEKIARASEYIGEPMPGDLTYDGRLDFCHIFVSASDAVGVPIAELQTRMDGTIITHIRCDDHGIAAEPNMRLGLGDRVRVAATPEKIKDAIKFFDDSYRKLSNANLLPFASGLTLDVLVDLIKVLFPGGSSFALGSAGGPLVVALILGAVGRISPLVWPIPYSVNPTFHTMGPALFLADIGTTAGKGLQAALPDPASLTVLGLAAIIMLNSVLLTLVVDHQVLRIPFGQTADILSGLQTHPAVLSYVNDQAKNELPAMGYTMVYPVAMIMKTIFAQVLVVLVLQHPLVAAFPVTETLAETMANPE